MTLPSTSALGRDASSDVGISPARCFAPWPGRKECGELSETIAKLRDGVWVVGQRRDVAALRVSMSTPTAGRRHDLGPALAASRNLKNSHVAFDSSVFTLPEPFLRPDERRLRFGGQSSGSTDEPMGYVEGVIAVDSREADAFERKLRTALDGRLKLLADVVAARASRACTQCATAYDRFLHVLPKQDLAAAKAASIKREGRVVMLRSMATEEASVVEAKRVLETERTKRAKLVDAAIEAWSQGRAPSEKDLRRIGGQQLVDTVKDRSRE